MLCTAGQTGCLPACSGLHVPLAHIGVDRVVLLTEGITWSRVQ